MEMQLVAWLAAALVFATFFMKTIAPLRRMAIASNVCFIAYALLGLHFEVFDKVLPIFVLHAALLPLNVLRLREIEATIKMVRQAAGGYGSFEFLVPFMSRQSAKQGTVLFRKGDPADFIYLIKTGSIRLAESDKRLPAGDFFGEVGIFSEAGVRTQTAICEEDCELYRISHAKVLELFYQDPRFGFFMARALSRYA